MADSTGYLGNLVREAEFDSSGRFTVDFASSRSRWENLARAERTGFLRLFLQALMASGARSINLKADASQCSLEWSGVEWGTSELDHLYAYFSGSRDEFSSSALQLAKLGGMLTSCRADLRLHIGSPQRTLILDGAGPRWGASAPAGIRFERVAPRPLDYPSSLLHLNLAYPVVSTLWPELAELSQQFSDLPCSLTLFGRAFVQESLRTSMAFSNSIQAEVARCAIIDPDPRHNNVSITLRQLPKPLCYLSPTTLICLTPDGKPVNVAAGSRVRCNTAFVLFSEPARNDAGESAPAYRVLKYGVTLLDALEWGHHHVRLITDGSALPTDISCSKAVAGPELEECLKICQQRLHLGLEAIELANHQAPVWQRLLRKGTADLVRRVKRELTAANPL